MEAERRALSQDREDRPTFQDLAREHLPRLYGLARRLAGDDAEDLVQEALMRGFRAFASLERAESAGAWLSAILLNSHRDRLRKEARSVREISMEEVDDFSLYRHIAEEDPYPYSDTLHADFLGLFDADDVHRVLDTLPPLYRAPLVLRYIEEYATKQIARVLDAPLGTILARLHRGRKLFERALWDYAEVTGLLEKEEVR
ncbi:MAG TPA: sigma-70 family RNA polymerase sigma factor [Actinomycetota bacterium]|nr:sigma-70 family RNA polymerase sigma factor [Actinomycetota bacterium]